MRLLLALALVLPLAGPVGCVRGLLVHHVVMPLDVDFNETPVQHHYAEDDTKRFQYRVRIEWGDEGIGTIAKEHGLTEIHYADVETLSLLNGVWLQRWIRVYGSR